MIALGAEPGRLRRQLLIETAVFGLLGGAAGAVVTVAVGTLRASALP